MNRLLGTLCGVIAALGVALPVSAADYPVKPVTVVVPFAPGGNVDRVARYIAEKLAVRLKQPFIVDNKPGALGLIGAGYVARAQPDGYTLLGVNAAGFTP